MIALLNIRYILTFIRLNRPFIWFRNI